MALPKIEPLSSEFEVSQNDSNAVKIEIEKLGKSIQDSSALGLKAATQAVVGNVPEMIKSLTQEIETGSISSFAIAMNKLIKLTESLSTNSLGFKFELIAAFSTFCPCSSVPVKKNTFFPNNLLYRAIISQAILV